MSEPRRAPVSGAGFAFDRMSLVRAYCFLLGVAGLTCLLDQLCKAAVVSHLAAGTGVPILGGLVRIVNAGNTGAAFSLFPSGAPLFALTAAVVAFGIVIFYPRAADAPWPQRLALALILGGATGNLVDRVRLGYVVDYIDLRWWPVFNLADASIVVGVGLLLFYSVLVPARG